MGCVDEYEKIRDKQIDKLQDPLVSPDKIQSDSLRQQREEELKKMEAITLRKIACQEEYENRRKREEELKRQEEIKRKEEEIKRRQAIDDRKGKFMIWFGVLLGVFIFLFIIGGAFDIVAAWSTDLVAITVTIICLVVNNNSEQTESVGLKIFAWLLTITVIVIIILLICCSSQL